VRAILTSALLMAMLMVIIEDLSHSDLSTIVPYAIAVLMAK
jgi:hypothetical protein